MKPEELVESARLLAHNVVRIRKARTLPVEVQQKYSALLQSLITQNYKIGGTLASEASSGFLQGETAPDQEVLGEITERMVNAYETSIREMEQGYLPNFGVMLMHFREEFRNAYACGAGYELIGYKDAFELIAQILQ